MSAKASTPHVGRVTSLPLVWIVPLVALALGGWLIFQALRDRGREIDIDFADGTGVEEGKTQLKYKGGTVGQVTAVDLKKDLSGVVVRVRLQKAADALARQGSLFWIERPRIGFSGVSGLGTLLTGVQVEVRPGPGPEARHFTGLEKAPPPIPPNTGKTFLLSSDKLASLNVGSPVFYREFKVGEVEASRLADDATAVIVRIRIEDPYVALVRTDTRFWNAGGFSFKVGLLGAELKNTSLEALVSGGVAFATPEPGKDGQLAPLAPEDSLFQIQNEHDKAWLTWAPHIPIQSPEHAQPEQRPRLGDLPDMVKDSKQ